MRRLLHADADGEIRDIEIRDIIESCRRAPGFAVARADQT